MPNFKFSELLHFLERSLSNMIGHSQSLYLEKEDSDLLENLRQGYVQEANDNQLSQIEPPKKVFKPKKNQKNLVNIEENNSITEPNHSKTPDNPEISKIKNLPFAEAGSIDSLRLRINECTRCELSYSRKRIVFGQGNHNAKLMVIGDFPNETDDKKGLILSSKEGLLLAQILQSISINIESVYLTNIVKCKPESKQSVQSTSIQTCLQILNKQIDLIQPKLILILGVVVKQNLFPEGVEKDNAHNQYRGISTILTNHPAEIINNPDLLPKIWVDMRRVRQALYSPIQN